MFVANLTKEFLFNKFGQENIFSKYGIPITNGLFISPLRKDTNPTCKLSYGKDGILRYFDNRPAEFSGDCVQLVMYLKNLNYPAALQDIYNAMNNNTSISPTKYEVIPIKRSAKEIRLNFQEFSEQELNYWKQYYINKELLDHYNIKSVKQCFIQDKYLEWFNCKKSNEMCFAYLFPDKSVKCYFPERTKYRFIGNSHYLQGLNYLNPLNNDLVITKSYKDVIVLSLYNIQAVAIQSESILPPKFLIEQYNCSYLADNDWAGKKAAVKIKKEYSIPIFLFGEDYKKLNIKDFSDGIKILGFDKLKQLVNNLKYKTNYASM